MKLYRVIHTERKPDLHRGLNSHVVSTNFFPLIRLYHAIWAGNPLGSHNKPKLLNCVGHGAATVWSCRKSGKLNWPPLAVVVKRAGLEMKCPGIYKQLNGNQSNHSPSIVKELGFILHESPCIMKHQISVVSKKQWGVCNIKCHTLQ